MKCVVFFVTRDDLRIIRYLNPGQADKTERHIKSIGEVLYKRLRDQIATCNEY